MSLEVISNRRTREGKKSLGFFFFFEFARLQKSLTFAKRDVDGGIGLVDSPLGVHDKCTERVLGLVARERNGIDTVLTGFANRDVGKMDMLA